MVTVTSHEVWYPTAPVEIAGTLDNDQYFYFHARHDKASLTVSAVSAVDAMEVMENRSGGPATVVRAVGKAGGYDAGWLTLDESMQMIKEMLDGMPSTW